MATGHPHVGDVHRLTPSVTTDGTTPVPLVGPITFRLQRPDGTTFDVDADLVGDGTAGQATYLTTTDDLDQSGTWKLQVKDGDGPWHADTAQFRVLSNLPEPA